MFWQKERKMTDFEIYCYLQFYAEKNSKTVTPKFIQPTLLQNGKSRKEMFILFRAKNKDKKQGQNSDNTVVT